jgi:hypothetical protein
MINSWIWPHGHDRWNTKASPYCAGRVIGDHTIPSSSFVSRMTSDPPSSSSSTPPLGPTPQISRHRAFVFAHSGLARISVFARGSVSRASSFRAATHFVREDFRSCCRHGSDLCCRHKFSAPALGRAAAEETPPASKRAGRFSSPARIRCSSAADSPFWLCPHPILSFTSWVPPLSVIPTDLRPSSCLCGSIRFLPGSLSIWGSNSDPVVVLGLGLLLELVLAFMVASWNVHEMCSMKCIYGGEKLCRFG